MGGTFSLLINKLFILSKPLFKKSLFPVFLHVAFWILLVTYAHEAHAGLFSDLWKFLTKEEQVEENDASAALSLPLLGSQNQAMHRNGTGGPADVTPPALLAVQDSALVALRNPAGTLPSEFKDEIVVYTVQPGDTPGSVAASFGISLNTLLWANNIRNANLIKLGDELVILPVTGVRYDVKKGDTMDSIAKKFKGDASEILSFNGLAIGESLEAGSSIIIPDGELAPTATPSTPVTTSRYANLPAEPKGYYLRPILAGRKSRGIHGYNGIDLADSCGLPVLASAAGNVIIARNSGWNGGYGKYIVVAHLNGSQTLYAHLSSIFAVPGQRVGQGNHIGLIGSTGNSTGCHVHFEIRGARNPF